MSLPITRRYQYLDGLAEELVPPVTEELLDLPVDKLDAAIGADDDQPVRCGLEQAAEPGFAGLLVLQAF